MAQSSRVHCSDNRADRELGVYWERMFCLLAADFDFSFTPLQIGRDDSATAHERNGDEWKSYTLPDITVWTYPGQHHEIKHKNPTAHGSFGLEVYRFNALRWFANQTQQDVMYTIHNHNLSGGRGGKTNSLDHWFTVNIRELDGKWIHIGNNRESYVNGAGKIVPIYYWGSDLWVPLRQYWESCLLPSMEELEPELAAIPF